MKHLVAVNGQLTHITHARWNNLHLGLRFTFGCTKYSFTPKRSLLFYMCMLLSVGPSQPEYFLSLSDCLWWRSESSLPVSARGDPVWMEWREINNWTGYSIVPHFDAVTSWKKHATFETFLLLFWSGWWWITLRRQMNCNISFYFKWMVQTIALLHCEITHNLNAYNGLIKMKYNAI